VTSYAKQSLSFLDEYSPQRRVYLGKDGATGLKVFGPCVVLKEGMTDIHGDKVEMSQAMGWGEKTLPLDQSLPPASIRQAKATLPKPRPNSPFKRFKGQTVVKV
jgi:hypothetical protein